MKPFLIIFYTDNGSNGYAIVNASNSRTAEIILKQQGANRELKYHIQSIEEILIPCQPMCVVHEGILAKEGCL